MDLRQFVWTTLLLVVWRTASSVAINIDNQLVSSPNGKIPIIVQWMRPFNYMQAATAAYTVLWRLYKSAYFRFYRIRSVK